MTRTLTALARGLNLVQFAWVTALTLVVFATTAIDGPTAVVGATVAIVLLLSAAGQDSLSQLHSVTSPTAGPPREESRLRGAFRRQSAPNTPGRPRQARAPGPIPATA
ncbi:MAG: hypothetical protein GX610_01925 [Rhodococcus sp.]|nr:hypothetical protein [Rhodococcus sp. (in: high G+C Gram-positive bacteria)]